MASSATKTGTSQTCRGVVAVLAVSVLLVGTGRVAAGTPGRVTDVDAGSTTTEPLGEAMAPEPSLTAPPAPSAAFVEAPPEPPPPPAPVDPAPPAADPAPEPAPVPAPVPEPVMAPEERMAAALEEAVPGRWREILPVRVRVIAGASSYAWAPDLIEVGERHVQAEWSHLVSVVGHEFGHLIAFAHGTREFAGAAPDGWPDPGHPYPAEAWADCVAQAFTGIVDPSYGMPPCPDGSLAWTRTWLDNMSHG